jgi:hypothetical protein
LWTSRPLCTVLSVHAIGSISTSRAGEPDGTLRTGRTCCTGKSCRTDGTYGTRRSLRSILTIHAISTIGTGKAVKTDGTLWPGRTCQADRAL